MQIKKSITGLVVLLVISLLIIPAVASGASQAGTTLKVKLTATPSFTNETTYDWSITKTANPTSITLAQGEFGSVAYTITATRGEPMTSAISRVTGQICVKNDGDKATEGLMLQPQVQYKDGGYKDLAGATITIEPSEQIPSKTEQCYDYSITFTPVAGVKDYRVVSNVTITNHSGSLGTPEGPGEKEDFDLPTNPTVVVTDEKAEVYDLLVTPGGLHSAYVPAMSDGWVFEDSEEVSYSVTIMNESAECGQTLDVDNTATLIEKNSRAAHLAFASVTVNTGECDEDTNGDEDCDDDDGQGDDGDCDDDGDDCDNDDGQGDDGDDCDNEDNGRTDDNDCPDGDDEDTTTPPTNDGGGSTPPTTNPPSRNSGPSTPAANVLGEVVAPTAVVETETPATTVEQEIAVTESTPAREELPYTGMNGLSALLAMAMMAGGAFIYRNSKV